MVPDEKLSVSPKATSVIMSALLIRSEPHPNESDSPQAQNPMHTNNNKCGSVLTPPKPAISLMSKDVPEGDATISWKDYQ